MFCSLTLHFSSLAQEGLRDPLPCLVKGRANLPFVIQHCSASRDGPAGSWEAPSPAMLGVQLRLGAGVSKGNVEPKTPGRNLCMLSKQNASC